MRIYVQNLSGTPVQITDSIYDTVTWAIVPANTSEWKDVPGEVLHAHIITGLGAIESTVTIDTTEHNWIVSDSGGVIYDMGVVYTGIPGTIEIPVIGEVNVPTWAQFSPEMAVFFFGLATACGIRLFRACLRWFRKASDPGDNQ